MRRARGSGLCLFTAGTKDAGLDLVNHDIIVVGGSAGSTEVLLDIVAELPADLPAAVFVAVHVAPDHRSLLPDLLKRRGPLPASNPVDGERFEPGHIYVAPPDNHLEIRDGAMRVVRGPRENGQRPSVDALFRSASRAHGSRVIGVVLSGYLDCGTAGMLSIKARGGISVVQDPATATVPHMPQHVLDRVPVDHVVRPPEVASLLARLCASPAGPTPRVERPLDQLEGAELGAHVELVCPLCQGVLTEAQYGDVEAFRCHVGHAFSLHSLVQEQSDELERALWAAVRSLEEAAALSKRVASRHTGEIHLRFEEKGQTLDRQADMIRQILLGGLALLPADGPTADSPDRPPRRNS